MAEYTGIISLHHNGRGVWDLDTFKGCSHAVDGGCYGICYANRLARARGYDFSTVVKRDFTNKTHFIYVASKLKQAPFIRIGVMCDPSYDWEHTINIANRIKSFNRNIVIITKHWNELNNEQLSKLKGFTINTSVSALDDSLHRNKMLLWYNKLKPYCRSVLRVNTADFNSEDLKNIQNNLLNNDLVIDNILRFPLNHPLVNQKIINVSRYMFLGSYIYASKHNKNVFFGFCVDCPDQCGVPSFQKKIIDWI